MLPTLLPNDLLVDQAAARLGLKAQREAQASLETEKERLADEMRESLKQLEETHRAETEALREEADRSSTEVKETAAFAVEEVRAEKETAIAAADRKVSIATEEVERLRGRLESIPGEVKAELESDFHQRERVVRDGVRSEVGNGW